MFKICIFLNISWNWITKELGTDSVARYDAVAEYLNGFWGSWKTILKYEKLKNLNNILIILIDKWKLNE